MSARSLLKSRAVCLLPLIWLLFCCLLYAFTISQRTKNLAIFEESRTESMRRICESLHQRAGEMGDILVPQEAGNRLCGPLPPSHSRETGDGRTFVRIDPACLLQILGSSMEAPGRGEAGAVPPVSGGIAAQDAAEARCVTALLAGDSALFDTAKALQETKKQAALLFGVLGISVGALIFYGLLLNRRTISTLAYKEQRTRIMANLANAVLFEYKCSQNRAAYSPLWHTVFDCPPPATAGTPQDALCARTHEEDRQKLREMFQSLEQGAEKADVEARLLRGDDTPLWCRIQARNIVDDRGGACIVGSITDIDTETKERLALQHKALYDALTGTLNRSGFQAAVELACGSHCIDHGHCPGKTGMPGRADLCPRTSPVPPCVFGLVDMDHFKEINDTRGHLTGDAVLQKLGAILRDSFPPPALVGRLGGDEFAFFLPHYPGMAELEQRLTEFQQKLAAANTAGLHIECSIGVIVEIQGECRYQLYYELADKALYKAKNKGRNCYVIRNGVSILPSLPSPNEQRAKKDA